MYSYMIINLILNIQFLIGLNILEKKNNEISANSTIPTIRERQITWRKYLPKKKKKPEEQ